MAEAYVALAGTMRRNMSLRLPATVISATGRVSTPFSIRKPAAPRARKVSAALRAYAMLATSAAKGAVRQVPQE